MDARSLVELPRGAEGPYRVFVNGVPQNEGTDYRVKGRTLLFSERLVTEGRLGFWRWLSIFLGLVGTYRPHHSVDVQFRQGGAERVATGLEIKALEAPERPAGSGAKAPTGR